MKIKKAAVLVLCMSLIPGMLCGCEEKLSREEYASQLVELYSDYEGYAGEIASLASNKQVKAAKEKLGEAEKSLDEIVKLVPPSSYKDEHKQVCDGCENEKTRMNVTLELVELGLKSNSITEEEALRVTELQNEASQSLEKSQEFYDLIDEIAATELEKESKASDAQ